MWGRGGSIKESGRDGEWGGRRRRRGRAGRMRPDLRSHETDGGEPRARAEGGDAKEAEGGAREVRVAVTLESSGAAAQVDKRVVVRRAMTLTWAYRAPPAARGTGNGRPRRRAIASLSSARRREISFFMKKFICIVQACYNN